MTALIVILLVLLVILLLPIGAWVIFSGDGLTLYAEAGPVKIKILPKKELTPEEEREKKIEKIKKKKQKELEKQKKKEEEQQKEKASAVIDSEEASETEEKAEETPQKKASLGAQLPFFKELLGHGLHALGCLKRKLVLRKLTIYLNVGSKQEDPAAAGLLYGRAWAAVGALTPILENSFRIRKRDIQVFCDFTTDKTTVYAEGRIMLHVGDIFFVAFRYGVPILISIIKNRRKGRKKNGTSNE